MQVVGKMKFTSQNYESTKPISSSIKVDMRQNTLHYAYPKLDKGFSRIWHCMKQVVPVLYKKRIQGNAAAAP